MDGKKVVHVNNLDNDPSDLFQNIFSCLADDATHKKLQCCEGMN
jgi:hypothetical protein